MEENKKAPQTSSDSQLEKVKTVGGAKIIQKGMDPLTMLAASQNT